MKYAEVYSKLTYEVGTIIFMKKDGTIRLMLGTRNINTASLEYGFLGGKLSSRDNNCNINNGNVALIDLMIGEIRTFSIDRLIRADFHGYIETKEQLDEVVRNFMNFKKEYEKTEAMELTMDMLD